MLHGPLFEFRTVLACRLQCVPEGSVHIEVTSYYAVRPAGER